MRQKIGGCLLVGTLISALLPSLSHHVAHPRKVASSASHTDTHYRCTLSRRWFGVTLWEFAAVVLFVVVVAVVVEAVECGGHALVHRHCVVRCTHAPRGPSAIVRVVIRFIAPLRSTAATTAASRRRNGVGARSTRCSKHAGLVRTRAPTQRCLRLG